jgi:signal transduction histidine kinase
MSSPALSEARRKIVRSASFRLSLRFAGIFIACILTFNLGLGVAARWHVERQAKADVERELKGFVSAFGAAGAMGLTKRIAARADELTNDAMQAGHQGPDGLLLAGALALPAPAVGWLVLTPEGVDEDEALWVRSARLPDGSWINVAASSETFHDIGDLMLGGAIWTVVIALPLALLSGALLSRTVLLRLERIARTADGVREGDLSRRAPLQGTGDEFDRLATGINNMLDTIEALTRNLRNVSVGIAHELRTPLARIRNRLVDLKTRVGLAEERDTAVDSAIEEIDDALDTFDALLRIGQIEANAQRKGFETVRLSDLVAEIAEIFEPVAVEHGKYLSATVAPNVDVRGDRALLTQMISNLLENAIEHTPVATNIRLEVSADETDRKLIVQDDGPGIPAEESHRIFDRFYRLDRKRSRRGNGLGLSLVRSICSLHGFSVRLVPGAAGARFEVSM